MTSALFFVCVLLQLQTHASPTQATHTESPALAMPADSEGGPFEGPLPGDAPLPLTLPSSEADSPAPSPPSAEVPDTTPSRAPPLLWPLPASAPSAQMTRFHFVMGEGLAIASEDEASVLRVQAMAQLRAASSFEGKDGSEVSVRGLRILLQGRTLQQRLTLQVQTGLSPDEVDGGLGLLDAWVSWKFGRDATVRLGQQRVFFDMASALRRQGNLGIVRENASQEFGMVRDIGASLFSDDFLGLDEWLAYRLGVYGGQGRNRLGLKRSGFLFMARLTLRPFGYFEDTVEGDVQRLDKPRLAVGLSAAHGSNITREGGHNGAVFDSFAFPAMDAFYWNADAMLKWKGLFLAGQYLRRQTSKPFVESNGERVWGRSGHGYVLKASGMLTSRWELAGRFGQQFGIGQTSPALLEQPKNEFAVGFNHYFIGHALKAQLEYSARFEGAKTLSVDGAERQVPSQYQNALRLQFQVVF